MKKILSLFLILVLMLSLSSCDATNAQPIDSLPKVVMVASEGGLGDESFNDMAYEGILKAAKDYRIEVTIEEPEDRYAYIETVSAVAGKQILLLPSAISMLIRCRKLRRIIRTLILPLLIPKSRLRTT